MKSACITAPGVFSIVHKDDFKPGPGWVTAKVKLMGICGTDIEIFTGELSYLKTGKMSYPVIPGHEWAGEVVEIGEGVTTVKPGDLVVCETHIGCGKCPECVSGSYNRCVDLCRIGIGGLPGACSEYICVPEKVVHRIPGGLPLEKAVLAEPASVCLYPLQKAGLRGGEHVAVIGPGPLGLLSVSIAKALGASHLTLIGTRDERLELGRSLGADDTVNIRTNPDGLKDLAGTVSLVVEGSGTPAGFNQGLNLLKRGGTLATVSLFHPSNAEIDLNLLVTKNLTIFGTLGSPGIWESCLAMLACGQIKTDGLVTHRIPFSHVAEAFEIARSRRDGAIKVILDFEAEG